MHTHSPRPRLSVAMIVRDEQEVIAETLDSVRLIADEMIVWDSGSEDSTISIARKKGAKVFQGFWKNSFSAARNACLEKVTGDWVLWLDAGEKLTSLSAGKFREFIDSKAVESHVYLMMVETPPAAPGASGEQIAQFRLMPAKAGLQFEGRIRETLYASIEAAGLKIDTAPGRILRHPRQHAESRKAWIAHRDLALLLLETAEQKQPEPRTFLAQGEAYSHLGDYDRSRAAFIKAIELSKPGSTDMLEAYYGLLSDYDGDPFLRDCQMQVCISALEAFPFDAQLLLAMGNYLMRQNRVELACRAFESAVKIGQIDLSTWHLTELPELAASCLAAALEMQGKSDEAGRVLIEALDRHPESALLRQRTLQTYIKQGEIEPANPELAALTAALPGEREIDALESSTADTETVADSPESAGRRYRLDQSVTTLQPPHVKLPAIRQDDASKEMMAKET